MATMKSLAHVVEAKDPTTRGHLDRTAHYGLALAAKVETLRLAVVALGDGSGEPRTILRRA